MEIILYSSIKDIAPKVININEDVISIYITGLIDAERLELYKPKPGDYVHLKIKTNINSIGGDCFGQFIGTLCDNDGREYMKFPKFLGSEYSLISPSIMLRNYYVPVDKIEFIEKLEHEHIMQLRERYPNF